MATYAGFLMLLSDAANLAQDQLALFVTAVVVFALLIGSFLNVVILRLPVMMERSWRREARQMLESDVSFAPDSGGEPISLAHPPST